VQIYAMCRKLQATSYKPQLLINIEFCIILHISTFNQDILVACSLQPVA